ncbi:MAG TPA: hypothetical protein VGI39_15355 [Polyangiaceae bacterium]|jgi:hypothetical protein
MFERSERDTCPHCDVPLSPFEKLPRSAEALADDDGIPVAPEHEPLPFRDLRRGKGAILALALLGLVFFFLPWIRMTLPDVANLSGFDLARRVGWAWGAACAWVVVVPTVLSRQSIAQLRGARVVATFLTAVPSVTVAVFFTRIPHREHVPLHFEWGWPIYATLLVSILGAIVSLRLGGSVSDLKVTRGSSHGQTLH